MSVVDASVWVSRLVLADSHHTASREWMETHVAQGGQLVAPILLLAEVAGVVSRRTGAAQLGLPALRLVAIDKRLGEAAAQLGAELGLRGADAIYVALAHQLSLPLVTWDNEQTARAANRVRVHAPGV